MPEADYLRLTAERLEAALGGSPLVRADLRWPTIAGTNLVGRTLVEAGSYGKHLFLRFDDMRSLHIHLRMEGLFRLARTGSPQALGRSYAIRAVLATADWTALGVELGMLDLLNTSDEKRITSRLGPEILAPDFIANGAFEAGENMTKYENWPICAALLQQDMVAGIGTIWLAESLWEKQIYPWTEVSELSKEQRLDLLRTAHRMISRYVALSRLRGMGASHKVHGKHKRFCARCGRSQIAVGALSGPNNSPDQGAFDRVVFWCPACQAKK